MIVRAEADGPYSVYSAEKVCLKARFKTSAEAWAWVGERAADASKPEDQA